MLNENKTIFEQYTEAVHHTLIIKRFAINGLAQLTCSLNIFPELHECHVTAGARH